MRIARGHSTTRQRAQENMIQAAKIHFEILKGMTGSTCEDQRSYTSRLTAVKVSAAYTATEIIARIQSQIYEKTFPQEELRKSESVYGIISLDLHVATSIH